MTNLEQPFDYAALPLQVREMVQEHTGEIRTLARRAAQDIVEIGERLMEVKAALGHGEFGNWLEAEFGWAERSARRFMEVAVAFKTANLADLNIAPSALYALASGSTPVTIREELVERAQAGETITHKAVKERLEEHHAQFTPPESSPVALQQEAIQEPAPLPPQPEAQAVPARPMQPPASVKKPFNPFSGGLEPLELQDGTIIQVPAAPLLPRERELKERNYAAAASRFDSAASRVLAALTALDVYDMEEVQEIAQSAEGRQLFASVRVVRIREMLEQVYGKWVTADPKGRTIDAQPLIEVLPVKKDEGRPLELN